MELGEKIRLLRTAFRYKQANFAKNCNMSQTTISNIESGKLKRDIPEDKKLRIASALGISLEDLEQADLNDLFMSKDQKGGTANLGHHYQFSDDQALEAYKQMVQAQDARIAFLEAQVGQLLQILKS
jgi:transcriptional regulator with XRE-family HTH domain